MLVEVNLGLLIASATAIGPFLALHFPSHFSTPPPEEHAIDPSIQKPQPGSGLSRALNVFTGRRQKIRGFVPLGEADFPQPLPPYSKTALNAETGYSSGGQITDEKPSSQFIVVQDSQTGRMITSPTFPKSAIKTTTGERGVAREKVKFRAVEDDDDDLERGVAYSKFGELEDEGEVAKWSNIGAAR